MMKKIYFIKCNNYTNFKNSKISYIFIKTLAFFVICNKCSCNNKTAFEEGESIRTIKTVGLIDNK